MEEHLQPVEDAIREYLLPALLRCRPEEIDDDFRRLLSHGVKQGGVNIRNPVEAAPRLRQTSLAAGGLLAAAIVDGTAVNMEDHADCVREAGAKARMWRVQAEEDFVGVLSSAASTPVKKRLARIGLTGAWLTVMPSFLAGTLLSALEFFDNLALRYGRRPLDLQQRCDACNEGFTIEHGLICKKGGLIAIAHDDLRDEAGYLCEKALTPSQVTYEPKIHYGRGLTAGTAIPREGEPGNEARGDVMAHGLWKKGTACVLDTQILHTDARGYSATTSANNLEATARFKKRKYLAACLEQRRSFMPLIYSSDGMAAKESKAFEKRVAALLSAKWNRSYSEMCGWVRSRMCLAVVRSNSQKLRGSRTRKAWRPDITDGAALGARGDREIRD